jgi:organic radical activating enzyme
MPKTYTVRECFYSLQGEGVRAGVASVLLRFAGCNLDCKKATHGFDCDTDFSSGDKYTTEGVIDLVRDTAGECRWVVLTGGEPALQVTPSLIHALKRHDFKIAIETNGTLALPPGIDWVCVSPKSPEKDLRVISAQEVRYIIKEGDPLPKPHIHAQYYTLSPAWDVDDKTDPANPGVLPPPNLAWCIQLCLDNPMWRLSVQQHKYWRVR